MDASTLIPGILILALGGVGWLVRQLDAARTKRVEEKLAEHTAALLSLGQQLAEMTKGATAALSQLADRLRLDELATKDVEKSVALVQQKNDHLDGVLDEIRKSIREVERKIDGFMQARGIQDVGRGRYGPQYPSPPPSDERVPKQR